MDAMYHERQDRSLCLMHTLNNLLQKAHFSKEQLDDIAKYLSPSKFGLFNPHKRAYLGDYDVEARWHDERDTDFQALSLEECWALIVNVRSGRTWLPFTSGRHWYGMRSIDGDWWVLDSMQPFPHQVTEGLDVGPATAAVREHLRQQRAEDDTMHLFVISNRATAAT